MNLTAYDAINFNEEYTSYMTTTVSTNDGACNPSRAWVSSDCEAWCPQTSDASPVWQVDLARLFYITAVGIRSTGTADLEWFNVEHSINGIDWIQQYQVIKWTVACSCMYMYVCFQFAKA